MTNDAKGWVQWEESMSQGVKTKSMSQGVKLMSQRVA